MYTQTEKSKNYQSRDMAGFVTQNKSNLQQGFGFVDNRAETKSLKCLQPLTNGYSSLLQSKPFVVQRVWTGEPLVIASIDWDHVMTCHDFASGNNDKSRWADTTQEEIVKWIVAAFNQAKAYVNDDQRKQPGVYLYGDAGEIVGTGSDGRQTQRVDMYVTIGGLGDGRCHVETAYPRS